MSAAANAAGASVNGFVHHAGPGPPNRLEGAKNDSGVLLSTGILEIW